jgi:hypothetical protein
MNGVIPGMLFLTDTHLEVGKAYTFGWIKSDNGQFKNTRKIIPLQRVWLNEALKEVASKVDICKNVSVACGYAKDLTDNKIIEKDEMFEWSDKIYDYIHNKVEREFENIGSGIPNPKDIRVEKPKEA